jgi:hypothetical protein
MLGSKILATAVLWAAAFTVAAQSSDSVPAKQKTQRDWPVWVIPADSSKPVTESGEDTVYVKKVLGKDSIVVKKAVRDSLMRLNRETMSRRTRDSLTLHTPVAPIDSSLLTKVRINGFRVQLYSGGNSRMDKMRAQGMAQSAKSMFTQSSVYTQFISPHWVCRMGDFKTHAEAVTVLREVRATGRFPEAVIVRCKVNAWQ